MYDVFMKFCSKFDKTSIWNGSFRAVNPVPWYGVAAITIRQGMHCIHDNCMHEILTFYQVKLRSVVVMLEKKTYKQSGKAHIIAMRGTRAVGFISCISQRP